LKENRVLKRRVFNNNKIKQDFENEFSEVERK